MPKGTIAKLMDRGFGFIKLEGVEFNSLREGQEVEFEEGQGRGDRPAAVKVRLAETQASDDGGDDQGGDDQGGGEDEV